MRNQTLFLKLLDQHRLDVVKKFERVHIVLTLQVLAVDGEGQVLGHHVVNVNAVHACLLESTGKLDQLLVVVELTPEDEATGPRVDGSHGVRARLVALLVLAVVARDGAVRSLALDEVAGGGDQLRGHHAQRAVALGDNVGLDVTVVVLARPHEATVALDGLGDHVVDQAVLVPDLELLKLGLVFVVVEVLENVLELAVVRLQDRVLGREVQGHLLLDRDLEAGVRKSGDRLGGVVHGHRHTAVLGVVVHVVLDLLAAVLGRKGDRELARVGHHKVLAAVLVAEGMAANADGLRPARNRAWDLFQNDRLTEHSTAQDIADRAIGRQPHFLEVEFLHTCLIWRNCRALDTDLVLLDRFCRLYSHLVVCLVTVFDPEVIVLEL